MTRLSAAPVLALMTGASMVRAQPLGDIPALRRQVAAGAIARALDEEHTGRALDAEGSFRDALVADPASVEAAIGYARLLRARRHRDEAFATRRAVPPRAVADDVGLLALGG